MIAREAAGSWGGAGWGGACGSARCKVLLSQGSDAGESEAARTSAGVENISVEAYFFNANECREKRSLNSKTMSLSKYSLKPACKEVAWMNLSLIV